MTDNTIVFHEPVRLGDVLTTRQILRSVSDEKTTKLGTGRFWVIDVEYRNQRGETRRGRDLHGLRLPALGEDLPSRQPSVASASPPVLVLGDVAEGDLLPSLHHDVTATTVVLGALATRDWRPMHHDKDFAVERNGTQDIFLNTPNQAAWFERYITDWTGPHGGSGRVGFRMRDSVFPGDTMVLGGVVAEITRWTTRVAAGSVSTSPCRSTDDVKTHVHGTRGAARRRRPTTLAPRTETLEPVTTPATPEELTCSISNSCRNRRCCAARCARCVRICVPPVDGARARGRPDRLLRRIVEADGRARSDRAAAPRGARRVGYDALEGVVLYEELGRSLAPAPHFV